MLQIPKFDWRPYLDIAFRRKWWIVFPVIMSILAGWAYYKQSPKAYKASTLILVESQRVPQEFVPSTVTDDLTARLGTITQQINSRTNLEQIVQRFDLYPPRKKASAGPLKETKSRFLAMIGLREASADREDQEGEPPLQQMVQNVKNKIKIELRARNQAFEISFQWSDPVTASQVANALAAQFIDQNLKVREEMAIGTTRFLDVEVRRLQEELQAREIALEEFKRRNMGKLPSQLQSNLNILIQLKEELGRTEEQAQQTRHEIQLARSLYASSESMEQEKESGIAREINLLEERLKEMRVRYTEQHPGIQMVKRRLEQLRNERLFELAMNPATDGDPDIKAVSSRNELQQAEMEQMHRRLSGYESRMVDLRRQIMMYEERVEQTSEVELELRNLERDYNAVNERFQALLRRKLDAELAEQMERRQQGERFRVVDPAVPPESPASPDRNRIMLMALALGLGMGGGLAYLRESLDPAFYSLTEVEEVLQPEISISLPLVRNMKKSRK